MKIQPLIAAICLSLGLADTGQAQLILSQNFGHSSPLAGSHTINVTLANTGPLILILGSEFNTFADQSAQPPSTAAITVQVDTAAPFTVPGEDYVITQHPTDPNNGAVASNDIVSLNFTTGSLAPGSHTVTVTFNSYFDTSGTNTEGGFTVIAPDELAQGIQSSIDTLNTEIQSNTNAINAFGPQLAAIQTALQNDVTTLNGQIATLTSEIDALENSQSTSQTTQTSQAGQISTLQGQVSQLQSTVSQLQSELAAIPPPAQVPTFTGEFNSLQSQINSVKDENKSQWMTLGGVGLLAAAGTGISAFELSQNGNGSLSPSAGSGTKGGTYNAFTPKVSPYAKKN